jgi:hypothetical protein
MIDSSPSNWILLRRPNDTHDRLWFAYGTTSPQWASLSTKQDIQPDSSFDVSSPILQTAVAAAATNTSLTVVTAGKEHYSSSSYQFMAFLHFADFQNTQLREFDIYVNDKRLGPYSPQFLEGSCVHSSEWYRASDGKHNVTLVATAASVLPPMLNALEIYTLIDLDDAPKTLPRDCEFWIG